MKKILIVAATAGLMSLAACQPTANNTTTVDTNTTVEANSAVYNTTETPTNVDTAMPAMENSSTTTANTTVTNTTTTK
jgi:ABC-type uncharacterized transport system auxiliary subunit